MHAAICDRLGPAGHVLTVTDVEGPEPGPCRVRVSGVTPTDWKRPGCPTR
jgi:NADPH:quinone reductase-like Zn-dependent oxidoreductase